jgi:hypothetical protein
MSAAQNLIGVDPTFFYTILYGFVCLLLALIGVVFTWIIVWFKYVPRAARQLSKAAHRHYPVNMVFYDEGYMEINASQKFTEEILQNPDKGFAVLPSRATIAVVSVSEAIAEELSRLPQGTRQQWVNAKLLNADGSGTLVQMRILEEMGLLQAGTVKSIESLSSADEQVKTQMALNDIGTQTFIERSLGVPVLLQYGPKGIALNAKTLALIQHGERIGFNLNPLLVKEFFGRMWVSNRIMSIAKRSEMIGKLKAQALVGKWEKWMPLFIILALTALILGLAVALHSG